MWYNHPPDICNPAYSLTHPCFQHILYLAVLLLLASSANTPPLLVEMLLQNFHTWRCEVTRGVDEIRGVSLA